MRCQKRHTKHVDCNTRIDEGNISDGAVCSRRRLRANLSRSANMTYSKRQSGLDARPGEPFSETVAGFEPGHGDFPATQLKTSESPQRFPVTADAPVKADQPASCCHYWLIETSAEPHSKGVCKLCGEERLFRNFLRWEESSPAVRKWNGRPANEGTDKAHRDEQCSPPLWLRRNRRNTSMRSGARGF